MPHSTLPPLKSDHTRQQLGDRHCDGPGLLRKSADATTDKRSFGLSLRQTDDILPSLGHHLWRSGPWLKINPKHIGLVKLFHYCWSYLALIIRKFYSQTLAESVLEELSATAKTKNSCAQICYQKPSTLPAKKKFRILF